MGVLWLILVWSGMDLEHGNSFTWQRSRIPVFYVTIVANLHP